MPTSMRFYDIAVLRVTKAAYFELEYNTAEFPETVTL